MPKKEANKTADWWARGIALLGIAVSLVAFIVPYWESKAEKEERLTFWSLLPDPEQPCKIVSTKEEPNLIQMPWTICLIKCLNSQNINQQVCSTNSVFQKSSTNSRLPLYKRCEYNPL